MKSLIKLFILLNVLAACSPAVSSATVTPTLAPSHTPIPLATAIPSETKSLTSTITPTFTITPTSTPQPPLTEHEWNPENVLILMRESLGDGGMFIGDLGPPQYILYADGTLFITQSIVVDDNHQTRLLVKNLTRDEICQHLNTLDQIGFLDYDSSNYDFGGKPLITGAPSIYFEVNAWNSKSGWYSGLSYYIEDQSIREYYGQIGFPNISPALSDAYYFLNKYPEDGFEIYKPNRLAVWVGQEEYISPEILSHANDWQFGNLPLEKLINDAETIPGSGDRKIIILSGKDAISLYDYLGNVIDLRIFGLEDTNQGVKRYYELFARPLLPYEIPGEYQTGYMSIIPAPDSPKPNFKLTCYPTDGVLSIPTP